jgi:hypothetical protein
MSKRQWLCLMGVWIMIFLFLGFPSLWHKIIALVSGFIIIAISYNLSPENKDNNINITSPSNSPFIENENHN